MVSFYTLLHKEIQREKERWSDWAIQDRELCEGSKEVVLWAIKRQVMHDPLMDFDHL